MPTVVCKTKVRKGRVLTLPKEAYEHLHLHEGDEVELAVRTLTTSVEADEQENPLLRIIGIAKGGREDGGENHDKYLYGSDPL